MEYTINAQSVAHQSASVHVKSVVNAFGITPATEADLPNPAELFLGSFASCILKNVERFSDLLHFDYEGATIKVSAIREELPPRLDKIQYN